MKKSISKVLSCLLIISILFNFVFSSNISLATEQAVKGNSTVDKLVNLAGDLLGGYIGILTWIYRLPILGLSLAVQLLMTGMAKLGGDTEGITLTAYTIFSNGVPLVDVNFFNLNTDNETLNSFRSAVATWYYIMRIIATALLLLILIYVGIRMALSTVATERVFYRKMFINWLSSMALLYLLHYLIIFIINLNASLVEFINKFGAEIEDRTVGDYMVKLGLTAFSPLSGIMGIASLVVYTMFIWMTAKYLFVYVKRMITIGFLIIISPLITVTYSIDKMGDGKAQALGTWLKEFAYNILIQPFHLILYLAFVQAAFKLLVGDTNWAGNMISGVTAIADLNDSPLAAALLAILCLTFVDEGEAIIRKIFGFDAASSLANAAMGAGAIMAFASNATKIGSGIAKVGKSFAKTNSSMFKTAGKGLGKIKSGFSKVGNVVSNSKVGQSFKAGVNAVGSTIVPPAVKNAYQSVRNSRFFSSPSGTARTAADRAEERRNKKRDKESQRLYGKNYDELEDIDKQTVDNNIKNTRGKRVIKGFSKFAHDHKEYIAGTLGTFVGLATYSAGSGNVVNALMTGFATSEAVRGAFGETQRQFGTDVGNAVSAVMATSDVSIKSENDLVTLLKTIKTLGDHGQLTEKGVNDAFEKLINTIKQASNGRINEISIRNAIAQIMLDAQSNPGGFDAEQSFVNALGNQTDGISDTDKENIANTINSFINYSSQYKAYTVMKAAGELTVEDIGKHVEINETSIETINVDNTIKEIFNRYNEVNNGININDNLDKIDELLKKLEDNKDNIKYTNNQQSQINQFNTIRPSYNRI